MATKPGRKRIGPRIALKPAAPSPVQAQAVPAGLNDVTNVDVNGEKFECRTSDLRDVTELGRGAYGVVMLMNHVPTTKQFAVKKIPYTWRTSGADDEQKRSLRDVEISMKSGKSEFIVQFFGALFGEGDIWILMEVMELSLDKFYIRVFSDLHLTIAETHLARIAFCISSALHYLKSELNVIHRDVKPSNMLVNRCGRVKLCDFGISGQLIDSVAKTRDAGCKPYMAPERIDPPPGMEGYNSKSDIELATGKYPYPEVKNPFQRLNLIARGNPPTLPQEMSFSKHCHDFVGLCLQRDYRLRPSFSGLLEHSWLLECVAPREEFATFVQHVTSSSSSSSTSSSPTPAPATSMQVNGSTPETSRRDTPTPTAPSLHTEMSVG